MPVEPVHGLHISVEKSGFTFTKDAVYKALVTELLSDNTFTISIHGKKMTAFSELPLEKGDSVLVLVKDLKPIPVLEIIHEEKVFKNVISLFNGGNSRVLKSILSHVYQNTLLDRDEEMPGADSLRKSFEALKEWQSAVVLNDDESDMLLSVLVRDKILHFEYRQQGMYYFSFPYIHEGLLREGYFSFSRNAQSGVMQYKCMVHLSFLGDVLTLINMWDTSVSFDMAVERQDTADIIEDSKQFLFEAVKKLGYLPVSCRTFVRKIENNPFAFLQFQGKGGVDLLV